MERKSKATFVHTVHVVHSMKPDQQCSRDFVKDNAHA